MSAFSTHGTNVRVAVTDPGEIDTARVNNYMYDVPLRVRSGARGGYLGWHGADIVAIIKILSDQPLHLQRAEPIVLTQFIMLNLLIT